MKNRNGSVSSAQAVAPALVCILCLLIPGSVALSQPFPSFMLDTSVTHVPGTENVGFPSVAFGPDVGLVVWNSEVLVRGARVDRNGVLLDSVQIDIDGLVRKQWVNMHPGVAWGGQNFLVVWADDEAMKYVLVAPDGSISNRAVCQEGEWSGHNEPAVAFDGTNFLVSWIGGNDTLGSGALFCRVSPQGAILDSPPRFVAPLAPGRQASIALCFHEDQYLAVWSDGDTIGVSGNFIWPDGSIADSVGFRIRSAEYTGHPAVTHDRSNFLVSWGESDVVRLARVSDSGIVLDTGGVLVDSFSIEPTIVSSGDTTLVVLARDTSEHGDSTAIVGIRLDAALNRLDVSPVKISTTANPRENEGPAQPFVALCGDDYFTAWVQQMDIESYVGDYRQVMCRRVNRNGELLDSTPAILSCGPATQGYPALASDGENFFAVWPETRHDSLARLYYLIQGYRFAADGTRLGPGPIPLGHALYRAPAAVAFGGGCYLVTWQDSIGIWTKRVTPDGVVLDSVPLRMSDSVYAYPFTDAAFGDSFFLVAWAGDAGIQGCRVTPAGVVLDSTPLRLAANHSYSNFPQVAFDGANFLVARRDGGDNGVQRCVRVSQNGAILDTADITLGPAGDNFLWAMPEVAYGNGVYFVVDNVNAKCWRVSPDGYLLDSVPHPDLQYAHVVFDGTNFILLCQSRDTSGAWLPSLDAIRITPDGRVLDSTPFTLVTTDSTFARAHHAAMSVNAANRVAAVFGCREPSPYLTTRIRAATFPAIVGIGSQREDAQTVTFRVWPNPASKTASLTFTLDQAGPARVTAFDVTGRECATLASGRMTAGAHTLSADTRRLTNGVYFLRLEAGAAVHSTRLVVSH